MNSIVFENKESALIAVKRFNTEYGITKLIEEQKTRASYNTSFAISFAPQTTKENADFNFMFSYQSMLKNGKALRVILQFMQYEIVVYIHDNTITVSVLSVNFDDLPSLIDVVTVNMTLLMQQFKNVNATRINYFIFETERKIEPDEKEIE